MCLRRRARLGSRGLPAGSCGRAAGGAAGLRQAPVGCPGSRVGWELRRVPLHGGRDGDTGRSHPGKGGKQTSGIRRRAAVKKELKKIEGKIKALGKRLFKLHV